MKEIKFITSNDLHIKEDNWKQVYSCVMEQIDFANKNEVKEIYFLGDIFNSRKSQSIDVLHAFSLILDYAEKRKVKIIAFPGNHDKTDYKNSISFLDSFKHHPYLELIVNPTVMGDVTLIPFFEDNTLIDLLEQQKPNKYLFSHFAVNGSVNNDGSKVESKIDKKLLSKFEHVFLGHYHNYSSPMKNVHHLPSIMQNNFGEDDEKGFTVIYEDGTFEIKKTNFKKFIKIKIDVNEIEKEELDELIEKNANSKDVVRFVISGSKENIAKIDKNNILLNGIEFDSKEDDIDVGVDFDEKEIKSYDLENIKEIFEEFCEEKELDFEEGIKYFNK